MKIVLSSPIILNKIFARHCYLFYCPWLLSLPRFRRIEGAVLTTESDDRLLRSNTDSCSITGTGATAGSTGIGGVWWCIGPKPVDPIPVPNDDPAPLTMCDPKIKITLFRVFSFTNSI